MNSTREKTMSKAVRFHQGKTNPSFSSTLLDEIYRSIDDSNDKNDNLDFSFRDLKVKKKQSNNRAITLDQQNDAFSFRNEALIEKMVENKVNEKMVSNRRQISPEFDRKSRNCYNEGVCFSSSTCSSDSSSGGFSISSSETELNLRPKPKPIQTKQSTKETGQQQQQHNFEEKDGILKLKLSAMKIYGNLKKVKQPISPGARLSTFINSLFTSNGLNDKKKKKSKLSPSNGTFDKMGAVKTPMCSSATSFSRSCLIKNTSCTREDSRKSVEKVVKFVPLNVIEDEKSVHKSAKERNAPPNLGSNLSKIRTDKEHKFQMIEKSRKIEHTALKQYIEAQTIVTNKGDYRPNYKRDLVEDDDASDSSSDLFELDHIALTGKNHWYCEDLPVYATTRVTSNRVVF